MFHQQFIKIYTKNLSKLSDEHVRPHGMNGVKPVHALNKIYKTAYVLHLKNYLDFN